MKDKTEVGPDHVLMGWMVRHCARVLNNFQVKGTGRTPCRSIWGKDYTGEAVPFGEVFLGFAILESVCWQSVECDTQQGPTIQQKDELASGRRAKRLYLRQNISDKYGRTTGFPGCVGIGQHTEERRARIEQEMVDKGDAIKLEISGNQEEIVQKSLMSV